MAETKDNKSAESTAATTANKSWFQEKYESTWLYDESHPWRLAQHIGLRGLFAGSTLAFLGAIPYAVIKRKGPFLQTIGRITLKGAVGGSVLLCLAAAERNYNLPPEGVKDRSYRLSYNWGQTKWDMMAIDGALLSGFLLRRPFGGVLPAAAVGIALGTFAWTGATIYEKQCKTKAPEQLKAA